MLNKTTPIFFDTVFLSNFALDNELDLLISRYKKQARITDEVHNEITDGVVAGNPSLDSVEVAILKGTLQKIHEPWTEPERTDYKFFLTALGRGEASCLARALHHNGTVMTDDRGARIHCKNHNIPYSGTLGILVKCLEDNHLTSDKTDEILHKMIDAGFYSPIRSLNEII